jgi:hypothetical protein
MDGTRLDQLEEGDLRLELRAVAALHVETAGHGAEWRRERASGGVFETGVGLERRLLTDDARAMDFLCMAGTVDDRPVPIQELHGALAGVGDSDRIEKEPSARRWTAVFGGVASTNADDDASGFGSRRGFEEVFIRHGRDSSRVRIVTYENDRFGSFEG